MAAAATAWYVLHSRCMHARSKPNRHSASVHLNPDLNKRGLVLSSLPTQSVRLLFLQQRLGKCTARCELVNTSAGILQCRGHLRVSLACQKPEPNKSQQQCLHMNVMPLESTPQEAAQATGCSWDACDRRLARGSGTAQTLAFNDMVSCRNTAFQCSSKLCLCSDWGLVAVELWKGIR